MPGTRERSLSEILKRYAKGCETQLALCDRLEAVADALPDKIDRDACTKLARALEPVLSAAHRLEED